MLTQADGLFAGILVAEVFIFYYFYSHGSGVRAVYFTWYAWIIDVLAILSGCIIMSMAIFSVRYPYFFSDSVPFLFVVFIFITGSWQASIHAVKLYLRVFDRERVRRVRAKLS
jgi:hypothetical protein